MTIAACNSCLSDCRENISGTKARTLGLVGGKS
jgi:hypothetical protein